jgi:chloramphenicol-sensitive protein RarD
MHDQRRGMLAGAGAYALWGLFPLFWPLLKPAQAVEILAHRIVWSLLVAGGLLVARDGVGSLGRIERRRVGQLALAAAALAVNWGTYIWAVNHGHVVETSLGYFINPLVTVALGVVVLGERLRPLQWAAIGCATGAVGVLTAAYGRLPWIALLLAASFAAYGFLRKRANVAPVAGMTIETLVLVLPALVYLIGLEHGGRGVFGHVGWRTDLLLASSGIVTAVPLLLFGAAAIRIPLTALGLLQYLAPTLQFLCGVLVFREPMSASRWVGFAVVWAGLLMFVADGVRARHRTLPSP